jgi:hypothetical protein
VNKPKNCSNRTSQRGPWLGPQIAFRIPAVANVGKNLAALPTVTGERQVFNLC